jgi:hypothetical protein
MSNNFRIQILRTWPGQKSLMGELYLNGQLIAMSLELPWNDNISNSSSIPEGSYGAILRYDKSRDGFFTIELTGTGPRTGIQIHVGNRPTDSVGCILLGLSAKFNEQLVGNSKGAISRLRNAFYGTDTPNSTPDVIISVTISSLPTTLRFFPSQSDRSFAFVYDNGYWNGVGDGISEPARYKEVLRDTSWIISKSEDGGSFNGRYVRWGILGGKPFQVSNDLKGWKTLAPDELLTRDPKPLFTIWNKLARHGIFLKNILIDNQVKTVRSISESLSNDRDDGHGDEDGQRNGVITYDFDDPSHPDYQGDEDASLDLDDHDTDDDYSEYDQDYDNDRGGDDDRGGGEDRGE